MPRFLGGRINSTALEFGGGDYKYNAAGNGVFDVKGQVQFRSADIWPTAGKAGRSFSFYTSSSTFTVPTGVTSISVICVGGGASGSQFGVSGGYVQGGSGGGGGAVAWRNNISVTPGNTHTVTVGARGEITADIGYYGQQVGQDGGDSIFYDSNGTTKLVEAGGGSAGTSVASGGAGGTVAVGTGYSGGAGGNGTSGGSLSYAYGGQGGGAGKSNGTGNAGTSWTNTAKRTNFMGDGYDLLTGANVPCNNSCQIRSNGNPAQNHSGPRDPFRSAYIAGFGGNGNNSAGVGAGYGGTGAVMIIYPGDIYKWPYPGIS